MHATARESSEVAPTPQEANGFALDPALVESYRGAGYAIVRGVFSYDEIAALSTEANRVFGLRELIDFNNLRCRWQNHHETDECRFDCFDPIIDLSPLIERMAHDPRIVRIASTLYGEAACLFKDKLIYKPPGAKGYALHQDYIAWPSFPKSFITVLVPIDPANDENGATEVFPGLHKQGYLSEADGDYHELPPAAVGDSQGVRLSLEPGDIAVFDGMTPHRSAPNRSTSSWRRQLYLSYNAVSDGGRQRDAHYREFHDWLKVKYAQYGKHDTYFA
jgi:ectoine hydroxylase-related dioxygenase (phytanoyl-CoA dioxygenase family)